MSMTAPDARQVLNWLGLLALLLIVVPFVIYAVPGVVGADGGYVVLSGSMEPSIMTGDVVIVDETAPEALEEGDVITYLRNDAETPTTHRIVEITDQNGERAFVTQGDNNDQPDPSPVPASQVIGIVILTIPYLGYVIQFANTTAGFVALIVLPLVLLVGSELWSLLTGGEPETNSDEPTSEDGSVTATEDNGEPVASAETDPDAGTSDGTIVLTGTDLRLSLGLLTGSTIYAGWVVYNIREAWSFAAVFASGIGLLLIGSIYYMADSGNADSADRSREVSETGSAEISPSTGARGGDIPNPLYLPKNQSRRDDNATVEADGGSGNDPTSPSIAPSEITERGPSNPETFPDEGSGVRGSFSKEDPYNGSVQPGRANDE